MLPRLENTDDSEIESIELTRFDKFTIIKAQSQTGQRIWRTW